MTFREATYNLTGIQFPTTEPLKPTSTPVLNAQAIRQELFASMVVNQNIVDLKGNILISNVPQLVTNIANRIILNKQRYVNVAHCFPNPIKWFHIALIHNMESGGNFSTYLGNGQTLSKKTTIVPKGRGPFSSFQDGAIDAIRVDGLNNIYDWSIGNTLYVLEGFNGYGYTDFKGINSPYIWSGSNQYISGYYIADNVYSKTAVSKQIGIALILQKLISLGVTN